MVVDSFGARFAAQRLGPSVGVTPPSQAHTSAWAGSSCPSINVVMLATDNFLFIVDRLVGDLG